MAQGDLRSPVLSGNAASVSTSAPVTSAGTTVAIGDLIYVVIGEQTAATSASASDNLGGSAYTKGQTAVDAGTSTATVWWKYADTAGTLTQVTIVTNGGTNNFAASGCVIEGPFQPSPLDKNPTHITTDTASPFTCPTTGTLAQADEMVLAFGVATGSTVWAATSPNLLVTNTATAAILKVALGYQKVTATTAVIPEFTAASNPTDCVLGTNSFKLKINVTASPTGIAGTGTVGDPTVSGKAITAVTGIAGTGAANTPTVSGKAVTTVTGVAGTGAANTPTVTGKATADTTGVAGTGAANTPTISGKAVVSVTGNAGTGAPGTPTVAAKANTSVTGVSGSGAAGEPWVLSDGGAILRTDNTYSLRTDGSAHILRAAAVTPVSVDLTGVAGSGAAGTITVTGKAIVPLTGVPGAGQIGTLTAFALSDGGAELRTDDSYVLRADGSSHILRAYTQVDVSAALTGVAGTGTVGTLSISGKATATLSGVAGTGSPGTPTVSGKAIVSPSGIAGTGSVGTLTATTGTVPVTGTLAATDTRDTTSLPGRVNITFIASAVPSGNPTTTFPITIPTVASGDLLILACTNRDATAAPTVVDTDTGGNTWVRKTSTTSKGSLWWKRATSATSGKVVTASGFTGSSSGVLVALRGCAATGDPFNTYSLEDNISGNEIHTGFTPYESGTWVGLAVHNVGNDNAVTLSNTTSPGALTQGAESLSTGGSDCGTSLKGLLQTTAAATGNITWAQTDGVTVSQAFAIKPYQPTGTLAATDTADTVSVAGSISLTAVQGGFPGLTEGADTAVLVGAVVVSGSLASTEAQDTAIIAAQLLGYDAVLRTDGFYALRAGGGRIQRTSAPVTVSGSLTVTGATDAAVLAGLLSAAGGLSGEDPHDAASFAGTVLVSGTVDAIEAADASGTSITVANPISVNSAELRTDDTYIWRTDGTHVLRAAAIQISAGSPAELRTDNAYILRTDGTHVLRSEAVATAGSSELRTDNAFILRSDGTHVLRAETISTSTELRTDDAHILRTDGSLILRASDAAVAGILGTLTATEANDDVSVSAAALFTPTLSWATTALDSTPDFFVEWQSEFLDTSLPAPVLVQTSGLYTYLPAFELVWDADLVDGDFITFEYSPTSTFGSFDRVNDVIGAAELVVRQSTLGFDALSEGTYYARARIQRAGAAGAWSSTVTFVVLPNPDPTSPPLFPYTATNFLDGDTVVVQYGPDSVFSSYTELIDVVTTSEVASHQTTLGGTALAPGSYYVRARIVQLGATTDWSNTVAITITDQITGVVAAADSADALVAAGSLVSQGGLGPQDAQDVATVVGSVADGDIIAQLAATDTADVAAIDGTAATEGSFGLSDAADTVAINGLLEITGALNATEAPEAVSITGDAVAPPYTTDIALNETIDTASIIGDVSWLAVLTIDETADTASLAGEVGIAGSLDSTETADAVSLVGDLPDVIGGTLVVTDIEDIVALGGFAGAVGGFSLTEGQDTLSVTGFIPCVGTINGVEASDTANISGRVPPDVVTGGGAWLGDHYDRLGKADRKRKAEKRAVDKRIRQTIARRYTELKGIVEDAPEGLQDELQAEVAAIIQPAMVAPVVELPQASYVDFGLLADRTQNIEAILAQMIEEIRLRIEDEEEDDDLLLFA